MWFSPESLRDTRLIHRHCPRPMSPLVSFSFAYRVSPFPISTPFFHSPFSISPPPLLRSYPPACSSLTFAFYFLPLSLSFALYSSPFTLDSYFLLHLRTIISLLSFSASLFFLFLNSILLPSPHTKPLFLPAQYLRNESHLLRAYLITRN